VSKRKLLLADDSVTIQKVVNLTFADEGIEVISVGDGDSAMAKVVELAPDLVMADVNMPGLNGYQICEQIRNDKDLRQTPVILLVGSFEPFDEDEARRVGADDFLTKPFQSIRQLVNKVTVLLNSEQAKNGGQAENAAAKTYEDTLEMERTIQDIAVPEPPRYDDTGFDDEMIQTNHATSYALDEAQKFETKTPVPTAEDDFAKTQPLTNDELKEFNLSDPAFADRLNETGESASSFDSEETGAESEPAEERTEELETAAPETETESEIHRTFDENEEPASSAAGRITEEAPDYESAQETEAVTDEPAEAENFETEENAQVSAGPIGEATEASNQSFDSPELEMSQDDEMPLPEVASVLESDEDDLLELPPIESDYEDELEEESEPETRQATPPVQAPAHVPAQTPGAVSDQISPELIEAIANKVMEKLSEKAVREVAWEVVPQMTELIVKKMAEEKLKE
jgi:CheY-like chemotaxis protein